MATTQNMMAASSDHRAMAPYWQKVADVTAGVEALRERKKQYLPQFPSESDKNYDYRNANSKFTDIFSDIVESLACKPFSKEVGLANDEVPDEIKTFVEDVDRAGDHLHVFAQNVFHAGIANAIDWILVEHTKAPPINTIDEERRAGSRPYWVRIAAQDMLAAYSAMDGAKEIFHYVKINETYTSVTAGVEKVIPRVRLLVRDPIAGDRGAHIGYSQPRFEVWEAEDGSNEWALIDSGSLTIGEIPLVPFVTGRRKPGTWQVTQPMRRVVDLQIEHYQQETNLKSAKELTAFPMFKGEGVSPALGADGEPKRMPIGPSTVLYAPMGDDGKHGTWGVLEISTSSLKFLAEEVDRTELQMRELGRQPLTAGTSGITQVAAAFASQRASSAVQAWAFTLKDALEKAIRYAAQWMNITLEPTIYINTDFAIELGQDKAPEVLLQMEERNLISAQTLLAEMKRRSILSPEFDEMEEVNRILKEVGGGDT